MKMLMLAATLVFALTACDGAQDNPKGVRPPAPVGTDPAVAPPIGTDPTVVPPPAEGQVCTQEARICPDGSIGFRQAGSCEQKCPGE